MLKAFSAGLPVSAKDILNEAMGMAFDSDTVEVHELSDENLRSRVRLANRSVEVILVILSEEKANMCADIENGLYNSGKYLTYTTDWKLAEFLNEKYGLELVVEKEGVDDTNDGGLVDESIIKGYEAKLKFKDSVIRNLEIRIRDLTSFYETEECPELEGSVSDLVDSLREVKSQLEASEIRVGELSDTISIKERVYSELEDKYNKLSSNYDSLVKELNELKITNSKQSGVIRDKDTKIKELLSTIEKLEEDLGKVKELEESIKGYKSDIIDRDNTISNLKSDLESKDRDLLKYSIDLEEAKSSKNSEEDSIESLKKSVDDLSSENAELREKIRQHEESAVKSEVVDESEAKKVIELEKEKEELLKRIETDNESLAQLNKEKIDLQHKISLYEQSRRLGDSEESMLLEIQDLRDKISEMERGIFTKIGSTALPNASVSGRVLSGKGRFNNIRFVFAGSAESRKGTYKCLLDEFRHDNSGMKYLIVDLVSETSIDYVFEMRKLVPGVDWFKKGGNIKPFLSDTVLDNTKVLSVGLGYINDSYFLCIDWASRLVELDNSGYKVALVCGDLSNLVGRVLHESFASYGDSVVYVVGNAVGSRTIITNLRGLSNSRESVIAYYDFNNDMRNFYDRVSKTNECKILSTRSLSRR